MLDAFVKERDGKIVAVARLQKAGSALLASAAMLSGYVTLVQISGQLRGLQEGVERVLVKMQAAQLGKIDAAFKSLEQIENSKQQNRIPLLQNAHNTLSEVLAASLREVKHEISLTYPLISADG